MTKHKTFAGYEEITHTADWAIRVWAPDLETLFIECARGMNDLSDIQLADFPPTFRTYNSSNADLESLLVAFLSELVYIVDQENLAFNKYKVSIKKRESDCVLHVKMGGATITSMNKAIKAVTYHNIKVQQTEQGYQVEIVFDV